MAFRPIIPPPDATRPVWEYFGLADSESKLERHRETGEVRVNPDALAQMMAEWAEPDA